jgi:hypothetical protein
VVARFVTSKKVNGTFVKHRTVRTLPSGSPRKMNAIAFSAHLPQWGGGSLKRSSPTDQETILLALRQDLEAARKQAAIASAHFDEVVKKVPSRIPYPDSVHRMQKASSEYAGAQRAALAALMRLNEFLIYGTLPPGLEKEQEPGDGCDGSP